jgi:hypothetical protein
MHQTSFLDPEYQQRLRVHESHAMRPTSLSASGKPEKLGPRHIAVLQALSGSLSGLTDWEILDWLYANGTVTNNLNRSLVSPRRNDLLKWGLVELRYEPDCPLVEITRIARGGSCLVWWITAKGKEALKVVR